jgi:hypothetical protein
VYKIQVCAFVSTIRAKRVLNMQCGSKLRDDLLLRLVCAH